MTSHGTRLASTLAATMLTLGLAGAPLFASAADGGVMQPYTNPDGQVWKSPDGQCWRNPAMPNSEGMEECGDMMSKKKKEEPKPESKPKPTTPVVHTQTLNLDARTLFGFNKTKLTEDGEAAIQSALDESSKEWSINKVRVRGYADRIGPEQYNEDLSTQRAQAVADYIRAHANVPSGEMTVVGMGERDPVVECKKQQSRKALIKCLAPNRRVEVDLDLQRKVVRQQQQ